MYNKKIIIRKYKITINDVDGINYCTPYIKTINHFDNKKAIMTIPTSFKNTQLVYSYSLFLKIPLKIPFAINLSCKVHSHCMSTMIKV